LLCKELNERRLLASVRVLTGTSSSIVLEDAGAELSCSALSLVHVSVTFTMHLRAKSRMCESRPTERKSKRKNSILFNLKNDAVSAL